MGKKKRKQRAKKQSAPAPTPPPAPPAETVPIWLALLVCVVSGSGWWLACADFDIWPLAWITMAPLFWLSAKTVRRRRALLYALLAGTVANAGGFYWIGGLLERFGKLPGPVALVGLILIAAYQAGPFVLLIAITRTVRRVSRERRGHALPMALVAPVAMAALETVWPVIFPFYLAITQAWVVPIIQIADITGPTGVTALLMMSSGALFDYAVDKRWRPGAVATAVVALCLVYGGIRMHMVDGAREAAPTLTVGVVQPNIGFRQKGSDGPKELAALQEQSQLLQERGADLIVWPETSYPARLPRTMTRDLRETSPWHIRRGINVPLVIGAVTFDPDAPEKHPYNTAIMFDRDGNVTGMFDKVFLLIFGEYTPLADTFDWVKRRVPDAAGHFTRGEGPKVFPLEYEGKTYLLGPNICYEDLLTDFHRDLADLRPHLLVNLTNDAWFGETTEPWEHMALSVYRAVELRTELVRAVNTGVSTFIDANGRVVQETYAVDPEVHPKPADGLLGEVALMEAGHTIYATIGPAFAVLCMLLTLLAWIVWPRIRRS